MPYLRTFAIRLSDQEFIDRPVVKQDGIVVVAISLFNDRDNFKGLLFCIFSIKNIYIFTTKVALIYDDTRFGLYGGQKVIVVNFATVIEEKTADIGDCLLPA